MNTSKIEKTYPELKGLPNDVQRRIFERAKHEIFTKEGKTLFWGYRLILGSILVAVIIYSILYFIFRSKGLLGPLVGSIVGVFCAWAVSNRNINLLRPKVRELAQNEKI